MCRYSKINSANTASTYANSVAGADNSPPSRLQEHQRPQNRRPQGDPHPKGPPESLRAFPLAPEQGPHAQARRGPRRTDPGPDSRRFPGPPPQRGGPGSGGGRDDQALGGPLSGRPGASKSPTSR